MKGWLEMIAQKLLRSLLGECPGCSRPLKFQPGKTSMICRCGTIISMFPETKMELVPVYMTGPASLEQIQDR